MQDFEFTIEKGRLFMLQTRNGKRTGLAAIRIAVDMCDAGPHHAARRRSCASSPSSSTSCCGRSSAPRAKRSGRRGGPGPGQGPARRPRRRLRPGRLQRRRRRRLGRARRAGAAGPRLRDQPRRHPRHGRRPGHPHGAGGMTSHAALVARQMGKVCVVGCGALDIDYKARTLHRRRHDGQGGRLALASTASPARSSSASSRRARSEVLQVLLERSTEGRGVADRSSTTTTSWSGPTQTRRSACATNADQPDQSANAIAFGAQGIGLCRTEHMFFERRAHHGGARDDPRRRPPRRARRRSPSSCRCSATTSPASSA